MAICVFAPGAPYDVDPVSEELLIGDAKKLNAQANPRREFTDRIHEFLIGLAYPQSSEKPKG